MILEGSVRSCRCHPIVIVPPFLLQNSSVPSLGLGFRYMAPDRRFAGDRDASKDVKALQIYLKSPQGLQRDLNRN